MRTAYIDLMAWVTLEITIDDREAWVSDIQPEIDIDTSNGSDYEYVSQHIQATGRKLGERQIERAQDAIEHLWKDGIRLKYEGK